MDIIFFAEDGRRRFQLSVPRFAALASVAFAVIALAFFAGAKHGIDSVRVKPTGALSLWTQDIALQEADVRAAIERAHLDLDALALRLGHLQARSDRLDALGQRVVSDSGIPAEEFAFDTAPGVGGLAPSDGSKHSLPDFLSQLEGLERRLADRTPKLEALSQALNNRDIERRVRPNQSPAVRGWISSRYGYRPDPKTGKRMFHRGLDFAGPRGSEVIATADGVVTESQRRTGYGNVVQISHAEGYVTRYAHNEINLVKVGQFVRQGEVVARMGATGRTTGTHVHYEVMHNGKSVNPEKFLSMTR